MFTGLSLPAILLIWFIYKNFILWSIRLAGWNWSSRIVLYRSVVEWVETSAKAFCMYLGIEFFALFRIIVLKLLCDNYVYNVYWKSITWNPADLIHISDQLLLWSLRLARWSKSSRSVWHLLVDRRVGASAKSLSLVSWPGIFSPFKNNNVKLILL